MIVVLKKGTEEQKVQDFIQSWKDKGFGVHISKGESTTILGLLGDTSSLTTEQVYANEIVDSVQRVTAPYKMASRKFHPEDSVIQVGSGATAATFGDGMVGVIASCCHC